MNTDYCKYSATQCIVLFIAGLIAVNSIDCYHHHQLESHQRSHHHKRQTADRVYETNSYKKTVTTQEDDKEPVEKSYFWSSSNKPNSNTADDSTNSRTLSETIKRITTTTLTEDNVIDNKPIDTSSSSDPSKSSKSPDTPTVDQNAGDHSDSSSVSERVSYNITVIHSTGPSGEKITTQKLICPENQFGNVVVGCRKCQCNDNIDLTDTGNCDPLTGKCLKCLYNTEGDHCDRCKANYTGDATKRLCHECVCNQLGTN